jgi:hypothetical protein
VSRPGYGLEAFVEDPLTVPLITNTQARFLTLSARDAPRTIPGFEQHPLARQIGFELCPLPDDDRSLLARAMRALESFDAVGATDDIDGALRRLARHMGWREELQAARANVTPNLSDRGDLTSVVEARIRALTAVDARLFDAAHAMARRPIDEPSVWRWDPARSSSATTGWHPAQLHDTLGWHRWSGSEPVADAALDGPLHTPPSAASLVDASDHQHDVVLRDQAARSAQRRGGLASDRQDARVRREIVAQRLKSLSGGIPHRADCERRRLDQLNARHAFA